jgi:type II secretory pathway pseudopilin PulG
MNLSTRPANGLAHRPGATALRVQGAPVGRGGLTLLELLVVLLVLAALGGLVVPSLGGTREEACLQATRSTLARVAQAIDGPGGYQAAMRYARDDDGVPYGGATGLPWPGASELFARSNAPQLHYLFHAPLTAALQPLGYDPTTQIGWRGPWLEPASSIAYGIDNLTGFTRVYGLQGDLAPADGWGRPVVLQCPGNDPAQAGDARLVSAGPDGKLDTPLGVATPTSAQKHDDVVLYLSREDPNP